jgi:hypothetical protein
LLIFDFAFTDFDGGGTKKGGGGGRPAAFNRSYEGRGTSIIGGAGHCLSAAASITLLSDFALGEPKSRAVQPLRTRAVKARLGVIVVHLNAIFN